MSNGHKVQFESRRLDRLNLRVLMSLAGEKSSQITKDCYTAFIAGEHAARLGRKGPRYKLPIRIDTNGGTSSAAVGACELD